MSTSTFSKDFSALANVDPYVDEDFVSIGDAAFRIDNGVLRRSPSGGWNARFMLDPERFTTGDVLRARATISRVGGGFDGLYLFVADADGNGYGLRTATWGFARHRFDGWQQHNDSGIEYPTTIEDNDVVEIEYTKSTGAFRVLLNGVELSALQLTDATYATSELMPVIAQQVTDQGQGGFVSFEADGVQRIQEPQFAHLRGRAIRLDRSPVGETTGITALIWFQEPSELNPRPDVVVENLSIDAQGNYDWTFESTGWTPTEPVWVMAIQDDEPNITSAMRVVPTTE